MSLLELINNEPLQVSHVDDVILATNLHHDLHAKLAGNGAEAVVQQHVEKLLNEVSLEQVRQELG